MGSWQIERLNEHCGIKKIEHGMPELFQIFCCGNVKIFIE